MVRFNWTNKIPYLTSTSGEYDACLSQALIPGRVDVCVPEASVYDWRVSGQQDYDNVDHWPTSLRPETSFSRYDYSPLKARGPTYLSPESAISGISYKEQTQPYDQCLYLEHHWPTSGQYAQPDGSTTLNSTTLNYGDPSASTTTSGTSGFIPAHFNGKPLLLLRDFK